MRRYALALCAALTACRDEPSSNDAAIDDAMFADASDVTSLDRASLDDAASDAAAPVDVASDTSLGDSAASAFTLSSSVFVDGGTLPAEYTCDGVGHSPPLAWSAPPAGTSEFAILMTTLARDGLKWNWVLHSVPGDVRSLAVGVTNVGVAGLTSDGPALAYSPPCSQGPGPMRYTFTVYALSAHPTLPAVPRNVTGAVLTEAMRAITLASASATVTYTR